MVLLDIDDDDVEDALGLIATTALIYEQRQALCLAARPNQNPTHRLERRGNNLAFARCT